ncbi:EscU/YscU/HrcU family type III secretion system export apparatus switch protein [Enterobacter hormaechei]
MRQMQRGAARGGLLADLAQSDLIVTKPTHNNLAGIYHEKKNSAPQHVCLINI